jgi:hypothetical protein
MSSSTAAPIPVPVSIPTLVSPIPPSLTSSSTWVSSVEEFEYDKQEKHYAYSFDFVEMVGKLAQFSMFESVKLVRFRVRFITNPLDTAICVLGVGSTAYTTFDTLLGPNSSPVVLGPVSSVIEFNFTSAHHLFASEIKMDVLGNSPPTFSMVAKNVPSAVSTAAASLGTVLIDSEVTFSGRAPLN